MTTDSAPPGTAADPLDPAATMPTTRARDERPASRPMTDEDTRADGGHRDQPRRDPARPAEAGADAARGAGDDPAARDSLIAHERAEGYRARWAAAQGDFIDEPRTAVTDADALVGEVLDQLGETFRNQRAALERQWADNESSTEDLRVALRRYRTFFDRLLSL